MSGKTLEQMMKGMHLHSEGKKLTPYQGQKRCFGHFLCKRCNKRWASGNSWADMGQQCKTCLENVYPYKQRPLERSEESDDPNNIPPHPTHLCEKCKKLGRNCREKIRRRF